MNAESMAINGKPISCLTMNGNVVWEKPRQNRNDFCVFFDYDGTVVCSFTKAQLARQTAMPQPPTHERLNFDGWGYNSIDELKAEIDTAYQLQVPSFWSNKSGCVEYTVIVSEIGQTVNIPLYGSETDWGDGTIDGLNAHTYQSVGKFTICCGGTPMDADVTPNFGTAKIDELFLSANVNLTTTNHFDYCPIRIYNVPLDWKGFRNLTGKNEFFKNTDSLEWYNVSEPKRGDLNISNSNFRTVICGQVGNNIYQSYRTPDGYVVIQSKCGAVGNYGLASVETIILNSVVPLRLAASSPFRDCKNMYVPDIAVETYKASWTQYAEIIKPISDYGIT